MNLKKILLLLLIFIMQVLVVYSIEDIKVSKNKVLSIEDCVNIALLNSPELKKYKNYVKIANSQLGEAKSDYFPSLNLGTGYYFQSDAKNKGLGTTNTNYYTAKAAINQLIYNFGKTGAKIQYQKYNKIVSELDLENCILGIVFDVRTAYFNLLAAKANVDVEKSNVQINVRQYKRTKAYFEEGLKSKIDLVNAEVNLSEAKIKLITAENIYDQAIISLNNEMFLTDAPDYKVKNTQNFNLPQDFTNASLINKCNSQTCYQVPELNKNTVYNVKTEKLDMVKTFKLKKFPYTMCDSIKYAKENRHDLKAYAITVNMMKEALQYAKKEYLPDLIAGAGYSYMNSNYYMTNGFNAGASLEFPLINGMYIKHRINEAKAQLDLALNAFELEDKNIYFEVQSKYINMVQLEKQIPLAEVKVRQSFENLELADGRYEVGLGNFIEYQDAIVNYNKAQQAYVKTVFDYNVARADLEYAMATKPEEIKKLEE